jgi:hypothetical protein
LAVVEKLSTAPVLLVEWVRYVETGEIDIAQPALGCALLIAPSFAVMLISRLALKWRRS